MTRRSKRDSARLAGVLTLGLAALCAVISFELFKHGQTGTAFEVFAVFAFCISGYFAFQMPTRCGVRTVKGYPCTKEGYGFLIGCTTANHARAKLYKRLGWERAASRAYPAATSGRGAGAGGRVIVVISENRTSVFDICMSVASLLVAVISTIAGIIH